MRGRARLERDVRGVVYAEFLMAFMPFFLLFLATLQLAFIAAARIVVKHAAVMAARSAVLVIDDDPYFDASSSTRRKMLASGKQGAEPKGESALLARVDTSPITRVGQERRGCDRLKRVRQAAYLPLSVIAPPPAQLARLLPGSKLVAQVLGDEGPSVQDAIGTSPWARVAFGLGVYNRFASAVTFPERPGSQELRSLKGDGALFADDEVVTVRLSYLFGCHVPLARDIVCRSFRKREDLGELRHAERTDLQDLVLLSGERFVLLHAEASMPNQGAPYEYASELCKTKEKLAHCGGGL